MKIKKCLSCTKYTMKDICQRCGGKTRSAHPPKYKERFIKHATHA